MRYANLCKISASIYKNEHENCIQYINSVISDLDKDSRRSALPRVLKFIKMTHGTDTDDFVKNLVTVMLIYNSYKVPRILNIKTKRKYGKYPIF